MDFTNFKWLNETDHEITENGIEIYAPGNTDYFVNPVNGKVTANAPFFYKEVKGDFILKAKIALNFESFFDADRVRVTCTDLRSNNTLKASTRCMS